MKHCQMACLFVIVATATLSHAEDWNPVKIEEKWNGVVAKDEVAKVAKLEGVVAWQKRPMAIATEGAWKQVWAMWKPDAKVPQVDFSKKLILVFVKDAGDPNKARHNVQLSNAGNLRILSLSTLIGFQPTNQRKYEFMLVPREGVTHLAIPGKGNIPLPEVKSK